MPWNKMNKGRGPIVGGIAILIITVSLMSILRSGQSGSPRVYSDRFVEIGRIAAEKTGEYLGQGSRVILLIHDKKAVEDGMVQHDRVFETALKEAGIDVEALELPQGDRQDLDLGVSSLSQGNMTVDDYIRIGEANPDVDAIVSLVGAPMADSATLASIPDSLPPIILPRTFDPMFRPTALLRQGIVEMVMFARWDSYYDPDREFEDLYEEFDATFQIFTADNVDELPY